MTSSVLTPMEPVEPRTQRRWRVMVESKADQRQRQREGGQQRIDAVQHTAVARQQAAAVLGADGPLDQGFKQITDHAHRREEHHRQQRHEAVALYQQREHAGRVDSQLHVDHMDPHQTQQDHAHLAAPDALPALAWADRRCQLAAAEGPAAEVGGNVGHPYQAEDRQDEVDAMHPRLHDGKPGAPQQQGTERQPQRRCDLRPAGGADPQRKSAAQHPHPGGQPPGPGRRRVQATDQQGPDAGQRQRRAGGQRPDAGQAVQPCPFPTGGTDHQHGQPGEGPGRGREQRRQQQGQQHDCGDHAGPQHREGPVRPRPRCP
mmetsp:Transcript_10610/g.43396  ORF Transcript_10610/g.43396 Transcript_10610/m.43396 type:complete len:317 (+) Transcript_10610:269-1219(+)